MVLFELVAILAAGLFSGASIYINLVEHPARMACGTAAALAQWAPSYKRGAMMQASLAVVGFLGGIGAWLLGGGIAWLFGGILLGLVVPFTLIVIFPTNRRLMEQSLDLGSAEAGQLLSHWNRLHAARSILSSAAFLFFAIALVKTARQ